MKVLEPQLAQQVQDRIWLREELNRLISPGFGQTRDYNEVIDQLENEIKIIHDGIESPEYIIACIRINCSRGWSDLTHTQYEIMDELHFSSFLYTLYEFPISSLSSNEELGSFLFLIGFQEQEIVNCFEQADEVNCMPWFTEEARRGEFSIKFSMPSFSAKNR